MFAKKNVGIAFLLYSLHRFSDNPQRFYTPEGFIGILYIIIYVIELKMEKFVKCETTFQSQMPYNGGNTIHILSFIILYKVSLYNLFESIGKTRCTVGR